MKRNTIITLLALVAFATVAAAQGPGPNAGPRGDQVCVNSTSGCVCDNYPGLSDGTGNRQVGGNGIGDCTGTGIPQGPGAGNGTCTCTCNGPSGIGYGAGDGTGPISGTETCEGVGPNGSGSGTGTCTQQ